MTFGLEIKAASGVNVFSPDGNNCFIHNVYQFSGANIQNRIIRFPAYSVEGMIPQLAQYDRAGMMPYMLISLPVGGYLFDTWSKSGIAGAPAGIWATGEAYSVTKASGRNVVSQFYSASGTVKFATMHLIRGLDEFENPAFPELMQPSVRQYGFEVYDSSQKLIWHDGIQTAHLDTRVTIDTNAAYYSPTPVVIDATRSLESDEDFFISLDGLGCLSYPDNWGITLYRESATRYKFMFFSNHYSHIPNYPNFTGSNVYSNLYTRGVGWGRTQYKYDFCSSILRV
jgi:hypothetical protein